MFKKSAVILVGGYSKRFGQDKGLVSLAGKPLALLVLNRIDKSVDDIVVVVRSYDQKEKFSDLFESKARIAVDKYEKQSPLVGALTGFQTAKGEYSLLLPCDTPFISEEIIERLFEICVFKDAVVPRWPGGDIEPLQAVYHTRSAFVAAEKAVEKEKTNLRSMINNLKRVEYVPIKSLQRIDKNLLSFFNINTQDDLKKAEDLYKNIV